MNIVIKTASGKCIVRPDTTWERDNADFYVPEFIGNLLYAPVLFARISKPGRSIGKEFAKRYYDAVNYGLLLYPEDMLDGSAEGFATASCLDHTSFIPFPLYNPVTLGNEFVLKKDGSVIFKTKEGTVEDIEDAVAEATRYIYVRTGDIIAIELSKMAPLCRRGEGKVQIKADYCENETIDFKIIY